VKQFYSYIWLREDGTPYYVGKGFGTRAHKKSQGHQPPKDSSLILVFPMVNEAEAFESERALIDLFGRQGLGTGCLINRTAGGQGLAGHIFTQDHRRKIASATVRTQTGRKHSPEHVEKVAAANRGKHRDVSHLAEWHRTHPQTPEWKAKVNAARTAYWERRRAC
jgi:hypothetical protein